MEGLCLERDWEQMDAKRFFMELALRLTWGTNMGEEK